MANLGSFYYTGAQSRILINGAWMEEALEIEGTYSYEQIPVYGYKSTHFNAVGAGRVIVSGALTINYVQDGYLYAFLSNKNGFKIEEAFNADGSINKGSKGINPSKDQEYATDRFYDLGKAEINAKIRGLTKTYWENKQYKDHKSNPAIRPEFNRDLMPFNIEIVDIPADIENSLSFADYDNKVIYDCYIVRYATMRRPDDTPLIETYQFIGRTMY